jgi:Rod binding domain-containing protein
MELAKLPLIEPVSPPSPLKDLEALRDAPKITKEQAAKDFESVLIDRLLTEMKKTIVDWGSDADADQAVSDQIHGIFWLYLARDIANNGGFGLWKDISRSLESSTGPVNAVDTTG